MHQPIQKDPLIQGGLTNAQIELLKKEGWTEHSVTYDGTAPFLFLNPSTHLNGGFYLAYADPGTLTGIEKNGVFLATACGNPTTCWRWLV